MFERSSLAVFGLLGLLAMGCSKETTSSTNIKTGGLAALIDVYADTATKARVKVELRVGGSSSNTYVNLENGDELSATAGDETKVLTASESGIYETNFTGVGADTLFTVLLDRPGDTTAADNSGTLPAPFELDNPKDGLSRKDDDLEVTWSPSGTGDKMNLDFDGDCIYDYPKPASDVGSFTVEKGTLDSTGDKPETCDVTVAAQRSRDGTVDSLFDRESWFRLHQRRSATFVSNP
jgi:hypothetical protein